QHKVRAIHKSIGGTRGPRATTAKSLVARGPREVPVELWIARRDTDKAPTHCGGLSPPLDV
ncbi:hypothetical protein, partial [Acetobacter fabarum]|uniref:hypothetical protein n=1 Tax=Acetobacter fabarum TaxID=483199 RepID=UPI0039E98D8E